MTTTNTTTLTTIAFAVPILPGQSERDRQAMTSCWHGDRREQHAESRRRLGITRESVWIQPTPAGEVAVVVLEARDVAAAIDGLANSAAEFDVWFRDHLNAVHGIDLRAGLAPSEPILDYCEG